MGVQAEQLTAAHQVDGVVEASGQLVLVEHGIGAEQRRCTNGCCGQDR